MSGVTARVFRSGKCGVCSGSAERSHTIVAASLHAASAAERDWRATPLVHKRCEPEAERLAREAEAAARREARRRG